MSGDQTKFSIICSLFTWIQRSKSPAKKRSKFRKFLDTFCKPQDYFAAIRLIIPSLDRERGSYGLKESVLATSLVDALGMARDSEDAIRLVNWRKGGAKTGVNAGNFALVALEVLQRRQGMSSGGLTIKEVNDLLDKLASSENRAEKISVISTLIKRTNAQEMKWIIMIILKDLKLGISEKSIFHEFHPDAEDLFNVTCDLKLVCEKLRDRNQRHKRQDIAVGKPVRPQLAMRVSNAATAWKKLHGKEVIVECKFDGDRIQIHKNGSEIHFFSRNFLDHSEYGPGMSNIIIQNIQDERCILDGEMLVWDRSLNRFAEFGSNQEIAKAAKDGLDGDRQLCYVAFDILYIGDTSVIHQSLKERQELLQKVVRPLKGRLEILVPKGGLNIHSPSGEPCWSRTVYNVEDVEKFFKDTVDNREEGIVLKDLGSKWEPSDRSGKWLKMKPEYIRTGSDLDVLIIGGYYGSGRRGGEVAQFLVGLAERPAPNTHPKRFISFCRVGTGLSAEELDSVVSKLKPYFGKYEYPKKGPPSFYQVTNNFKERPDVWIQNPEKSIILSITSDIRTIRSDVFAAPYSLRFPRIDRVRYDKPWHECLNVESFVDLVHSSNGTTQRETGYENQQERKPRQVKSSKRGEKKNVAFVPLQFIQTDISNVKSETLIFCNMVFYFVNVPQNSSLDSLHKMVAENGGTFSMNLNNSVTHCVAAENKGIKFQAAKCRGDVIHYSWVLDCCSQKKRLPLQPKYFLFISDSSKKKMQEEIDEFSDSYYWDVDLEDLKQLLCSIDRSEDNKIVDYYKKKYCPGDKWSLFHGCCIYIHNLLQSSYPDCEEFLELLSRRLKIEVTKGGGRVGNSLSHATHLVVLSERGSDLDFDAISKEFTSADKRFLRSKGLHVVGSHWIEDSLEQGQKLQENIYSLKPNGVDDLFLEENKDSVYHEQTPYMDNEEKQNLPSSPENKERLDKCKLVSENPIIATTSKRKRGRPAAIKGKPVVSHAQRPRTVRLRRRPAKIHEIESGGSGSDDNKQQEIEMKENEDVIHGILSMDNSNAQETNMVEDSELSRRQMVAEKGVAYDISQGCSTEAPVAKPSGLHNASNCKMPQKQEDMVDPFQAMLMDMIPSLGIKKVETTPIPIPVLEDEKLPKDSDPDPAPVKKKKVSYKDVAGELLKDW